MHKLVKLTCVGLIVIPAVCQAAEVHPEVQRALNYNLPELTCKQPKLPGASKDVVDPATGAVNRADVDSYTLGRFERAERRWKKCVTKYKKGLMKDFERLKDSASHGLTQTQANAIMANMKLVQEAMISPTGEPAAKDT